MCDIQFPNQGSNLGPLHWEHRVLAGSPPAVVLDLVFVSGLLSASLEILMESQ